MQAGNTFRSHLMQQFVSTARNQSRPPLVMMPWMAAAEEEEEEGSTTTKKRGEQTTTKSSIHQRHSSSVAHCKQTMEASDGLATNKNDKKNHRSSSLSSSFSPCLLPLVSVQALSSSISSSDGYDESTNKKSRRMLEPDHSFDSVEPRCLSVASNDDSHYQALLREDVTTNADEEGKGDLDDALQTASVGNYSSFPPPPSFWKGALDRAVACGYHRAPNLNQSQQRAKREYMRFQQLLSPSLATKRLVDIVYRVTLLLGQQQQQQQQQSSSSSSKKLSRHHQRSSSQQRRTAEKERIKWNQIPAFLVAMVRSSSAAARDHPLLHTPTPPPAVGDGNEQQEQNFVVPIKGESHHLYDPMDFVLPKTERELEDYASTCAAVQNILFSLQEEQIGTKWVAATECPIIQTLAFRQLVGATCLDRIVALVIVGISPPHHPLALQDDNDDNHSELLPDSHMQGNIS